MNNNDLAKIIADEMIKYKTTNESLCEVYTIIFNKYKSKTKEEKNAILAKVVHYITIAGYDIDCIKPLKFKKF